MSPSKGEGVSRDTASNSIPIEASLIRICRKRTNDAVKTHRLVEIYVGNLSFDATEGDLTEAFEQFGSVAQLKIITDRESGRSRGFAFVTMDDAEQAKAAIEGLNGQDLMGRELSVREATPRPPRQSFGGGGGGGGYRGGGGGGGYRGGGGGGHRGGGGGRDRRGGGRY